MTCKHKKKVFVSIERNMIVPANAFKGTIKDAIKIDIKTTKMKKTFQCATFYCPECNTLLFTEIKNVEYHLLPPSDDDAIINPEDIFPIDSKTLTNSPIEETQKQTIPMVS